MEDSEIYEKALEYLATIQARSIADRLRSVLTFLGVKQLDVRYEPWDPDLHLSTRKKYQGGWEEYEGMEVEGAKKFALFRLYVDNGSIIYQYRLEFSQ